MARSYLTVPAELEPYAEAIAEHLVTNGYTVVAEPKGSGMPYLPALRARRPPTTILIEVDAQLRMPRLREWARFAKSAKRDLRVVVGLPHSSRRKARDEEELRSLGIGLYVVDGSVVEVAVMPDDLALQKAPPPLAGRPAKSVSCSDQPMKRSIRGSGGTGSARRVKRSSPKGACTCWRG